MLLKLVDYYARRLLKRESILGRTFMTVLLVEVSILHVLTLKISDRIIGQIQNEITPQFLCPWSTIDLILSVWYAM